MTEKEKIKKAKNDVKTLVLIGGFYFMMSVLLFVDGFFIENEEPISFTGTVAIFFYVIIALSLAFTVTNAIRLKNPKSIRNKAIRDSDERFIQIQRQANSSTHIVMYLVLIFGMLLSFPFDSIELFGFSFVSLILMVIIHSIIKLIIKKRY